MTKNRVLLVDDDKAILRSIGLVLDRNGFITDKAETGKEALSKIKTQAYNVLLVDLKLPDMEGTEILSQIESPETVKIMFTGFPSLVSGMQAMDKGVDAYLPKPVKPEELVGVIKAKLAQRKK
ncbi:response regulator [Candidatus Bathyarchaeota archaeon]|nr:response regulator [Candidatus Bathyarchaeota archaeon]